MSYSADYAKELEAECGKLRAKNQRLLALLDPDNESAVAQSVADALNPVYEFEDYNRKTKEFFMAKSHQYGPDDQAWVVFRASDGNNSMRAATYGEIVAATLAALRATSEGNAA